jgi:hypothetical protein
MRGVIMAFLVWLFSFWTWFEAFFRLLWFRTPPLVSDQATSGASPGVEPQLWSNEGQHESALATFLSSLLGVQVGRLMYCPGEDGFKLYNWKQGEFSGDEPTHREFLAALASSKVVSGTELKFEIDPFTDNFDRPELLEEIVGALVSNNSFKAVDIKFPSGCSALQMAECVSNLLLGNKAIEELTVQLQSGEVVGRESAELLANGLHENRVLKTLDLWWIRGLVYDEAVEVIIRPLKENDSILQELRLRKITDVGLEHLGVMLGTNTSLKALQYWDYYKVTYPERGDEPVYMRGYTSLKEALGINRSLERLECSVASSTELKLLLEPLMPVNNNPQANTTLTSLQLYQSRIGGKEGVDILVDMIRTNTSLLDLNLFKMKELDDSCPNPVENVVAILEALKTNKSLKRVSFGNCGGVGGYKVLGTMMDLLLENRQLEGIDLAFTPLEDSGDAVYVHFELEKRKKMKLWDLVKGMADESPKSGRVFMCGNPYAGE